MSTISNILRGNDFSLCIHAKKVMEEESEDISFADFTDLAVYLTRTYSADRVEKAYTINDDGDLIVPMSGLSSATYGIEVIGLYNGNHWRWARHEIFRIVEYAEKSTFIDSETIDADVYIVNVRVGDTALTRADMEQYVEDELLIKEVEVSVDNNTGTPSGSGSYSTNKLSLEFHGVKGEQGTSAIWDGDAEVLTELEHTTGQATNRTMSQKGVTDIIDGVDNTSYTQLTLNGDSGKYWNYSLKRADTSSGYIYTKQACSVGEKFRITGLGGNVGNSALYGWLTGTVTLLSKDPYTPLPHNTRNEPIIVTAPAGATFLVVNFASYDSTTDKLEKVVETHTNGIQDNLNETVRFTEQTLSQEQQKQALENLGIENLEDDVAYQTSRVDTLYKPVVDEIVTTTSGRVEKSYTLLPNTIYYVQITSDQSNSKYLHLYTEQDTPDVYSYANRISTVTNNVYVKTTDTKFVLTLHSASYSGTINYTVKIFQANSLVRNVDDRLVPPLSTIIHHSVQYIGNTTPYVTSAIIPIPDNGVYKITVTRKSGTTANDKARFLIRKSSDTSDWHYAYKDTSYGVPVIIANYDYEDGYDQFRIWPTNDATGTFDFLVERLDTTTASYENNRTIMLFGDSLTQVNAQNAGGSQRDAMRWSDWMRCIKPGIKVHNLAIGGTRYSRRAALSTTPSSIPAWAAMDIVSLVNGVCENDYTYLDPAAERLLNTDGKVIPTKVVARAKAAYADGLDKVTDIILMAGANDWFSGQNTTTSGQNRAMLGTIDSNDDTTILGALNIIINKLCTTMPQARVYLATQPPIYRWDSPRTDQYYGDNWHDSNTGLSEADIMEGVRQIAAKYHLPVIDLYKELGWNQINFANYFPATDSHHPLYGFDKMAEFICKHIFI